MRTEDREASRLPRRSLSRLLGFTLVEMMIVLVITTILMSALVMTLHIGEVSTSMGSARVDLESEVRMLSDWITRDVRQAKIQRLCNDTNDPRTDHIKFNLWNWDNATQAQIMTEEYIEYEYDSGTRNLTRRFIVDNVIENEWSFSDITLNPFYTQYTDEFTNAFNKTDLQDHRTLIVVIKKEKPFRTTDLNFTLVREVNIRNE